MAKNGKISKELEDKIQALAGEIFVQVEETVAEFLSTQDDNNKLTDDDVTQHNLYQSLEQQHNHLSQQAEQLTQKLEALRASHNQTTKKLEQTINEQRQQIENNTAFNDVKLTDTEATLQQKLAENSALVEQNKQLLAKEQTQTSELQQSIASNLALNARVEELQISEKTLQKSEQAKLATLDVQNQQISELGNQLNVIGAELELVKTQNNQQSSTTEKSLHESNEKAQSLLQQVAQLTATVDSDKTTLAQKDGQIVQLTQDNKSLQDKVTLQLDELETQQKEITQFERSIDIKDQSIIELKEQSEKSLTLLQTQLQKSQQECQVLTTDLAAQSEQLQQQLNEIAEQKSQLSALDQVQQETTQRHNVLLKDKENIIENITNDNHSLQEQINTQTDSLAEIQHQHIELQQLFEQLKTDHHTNQQDNAELTSMVADKEQQVIDLQAEIEKLKHQSADEISQLSQQLSTSEQQHESCSQALEKLQLNHDELAASYHLSQQQINDAQHEIANLSDTLSHTERDLARDKQRFSAQIEKRDKQEAEYNKARETIKYLRDENTELTQQLDQQVSELESQLTEYRLRFEYAQKELAKKSS